MNEHRSFRFFVESWLQWQVVTGVSLALALTLLPAVAMLNFLAPSWYLRLLASAFILGILLGLCQWLCLRLEVESIWRWSLASSIGWTTALAMMALVFQIKILPFDGIIAAALAGFTVGSSQSLVLLPQSRRKAWIIGTVVGWSTAATIAASFSPDYGLGILTDSGMRMLYSFATGWVLLALIISVGFIIFCTVPHERDVNQPVKWWP